MKGRSRPALRRPEDAESLGVAVEYGDLPDMQVARRYIKEVHELLDWAPATLVPVRASMLAARSCATRNEHGPMTNPPQN